MWFRNLQTGIWVLGLAAITGCSGGGSSGDRPDPGGSGGGSDVELNADDIANFGGSFASSFGFVGFVLSQSPGVGPSGGDPCVDTDSDVDGDDYTMTITLDGCELLLGPDKTALVSGLVDVKGTTYPDLLDIEALIDGCSDFIPDLGERLADEGEASLYVEVGYDYESTCVESGETLSVQDGSAIVAVFSRAFLVTNRYRGEIRFADRSDVLSAEFTYHMFFDEDSDYPAGAFVLKLMRGEETRTVTFEFDGTNIVTFTIEETGRTGTFDLNSDDADFDL